MEIKYFPVYPIISSFKIAKISLSQLLILMISHQISLPCCCVLHPIETQPAPLRGSRLLLGSFHGAYGHLSAGARFWLEAENQFMEI